MNNTRHTEKSKVSSLLATDPLIRPSETVLTESIIDVYQNDTGSSSQTLLRERPFLAACLCLVSACFFSLNFASAKVVYSLYPSYSPVSMLFMRAVAASCFIVPQAVYVHAQARRKSRREQTEVVNVLLPRNASAVKLIASVALIQLVQSLAFFMIKRLSMSGVSMFLNLGPILTAFVAGFFIASEGAKCSDAVKVIVSFAGVALIVLGKKEALSGAGVEADEIHSFSLWYYAIMAIAPIAIVCLNLTMAGLRNLHQIVIPFYMSVSTWILYGIIGLILREGFLPSQEEFDHHGKFLFWFLVLVVNGFCNVCAWQLKVLAYRHDRVTRVSPIFYVETAISLLFDILLFKVAFSAMQLIGLAVVLAMFLVIIIMAYAQGDRKQINTKIQ